MLSRAETGCCLAAALQIAFALKVNPMRPFQCLYVKLLHVLSIVQQPLCERLNPTQITVFQCRPVHCARFLMHDMKSKMLTQKILLRSSKDKQYWSKRSVFICIHSLSVTVIQTRVVVEPSHASPGNTGQSAGPTVAWNHAHTYIHTQRQFTVTNPTINMFSVGRNKPSKLKLNPCGHEVMHRNTTQTVSRGQDHTRDQ